MQEAANKQKRITLKTIHQMLDGMSVEQAEKVHLLFMVNYIDYSDYDFRDENQVDGYCWCYRDLFELKTKESQEIVNSQLIEFLDEWRQDAPSRYRKAKDDICYWINDEWNNFESPMQKEIESAYQAALKKKDDLAYSKINELVGLYNQEDSDSRRKKFEARYAEFEFVLNHLGEAYLKKTYEYMFQKLQEQYKPDSARTMWQQKLNEIEQERERLTKLLSNESSNIPNRPGRKD